jgi:hypothetical protein
VVEGYCEVSLYYEVYDPVCGYVGSLVDALFPPKP